MNWIRLLVSGITDIPGWNSSWSQPQIRKRQLYGISWILILATISVSPQATASLDSNLARDIIKKVGDAGECRAKIESWIVGAGRKDTGAWVVADAYGAVALLSTNLLLGARIIGNTDEVVKDRRQSYAERAAEDLRTSANIAKRVLDMLRARNNGAGDTDTQDAINRCISHLDAGYSYFGNYFFEYKVHKPGDTINVPNVPPSNGSNELEEEHSYLFRPDGCEYEVTFPAVPVLEKNSAELDGYTCKTTVGFLIRRSTNTALKAECTVCPGKSRVTQVAGSEAMTALRTHALQSGVEEAVYSFRNTAIGPVGIYRGILKSEGNTFVSVWYFGSSSGLTLVGSAPYADLSNLRVDQFASSVKASQNYDKQRGGH